MDPPKVPAVLESRASKTKLSLTPKMDATSPRDTSPHPALSLSFPVLPRPLGIPPNADASASNSFNSGRRPRSARHRPGTKLSPRTLRPAAFVPPKLERFDRSLKTNLDDVASCLEQIQSKKIRVQNEFDSEIVSHLVQYIESLTSDFGRYDKYVKSIESAYEEVETEYYKSQENVTSLENEMDILESHIEQERDIFKQSMKHISVRAGLTLDKMDSVSKELGVEFEENEIENVKQECMDRELQQLKERQKTLEKLEQDIASCVKQLSSHKSKLSTIEALEKNNEQVVAQLSQTQDILTQVTSEKNARIKEQDAIISEQTQFIKDLTDQITGYESEIKTLLEKLQQNSDETKELELQLRDKEKMFEKSKQNRDELLVKLRNLSSQQAAAAAAAAITVVEDPERERSASSGHGVLPRMRTPDFEQAGAAAQTELAGQVKLQRHDSAMSSASEMGDINDLVDAAEVRELMDQLAALQLDKQICLKQIKNLTDENKRLSEEIERCRDARSRLSSDAFSTEEKVNENSGSERKRKAKKRHSKKHKRGSSSSNRNDLAGHRAATCVVFGSSWF